MIKIAGDWWTKRVSQAGKWLGEQVGECLLDQVGGWLSVSDQESK